MDVEIVAIGDEVLSGKTLNCNAAFLSRKFLELGVQVKRHTVLPDHIETIREGLFSALKRSDLVIVTGGLGPTLDDLTKEAARPLFDKVPVSLKNPVGVASGLMGEKLILLPGVPREMETMFQEEVLPCLHIKREFFFSRSTLCLLKEIEVDSFLRSIKNPNIQIGIYPAYGSLQVTFQSKEPVDGYVQKLKEKFPTFFVGEKSVEEALYREMIARKKTLALAESCTGGAIAAKITSIPDASLFFLGSLVVYANSWKERFLGVRHDTLSKLGAVSKEAVHEMIYGLMDETDTDFAMAVSGILGPTGGSKEKPVGTVYVALAERGGKIDLNRIEAPQDRKAGIAFVKETMLAALWRRLVHNTLTFS